MAQMVELAKDDTATRDVATAFPRTLLRDRVAIITGASRGIGRAAAVRLAEAGARVVVNYLQRDDAADETIAELEQIGALSLVVKGDIAAPGVAQSLVEKTLARFGRVDVLIANAGIWEGSPIEDMPVELWDRVLDANLKGTFTACRAVVPVMKKAGSGSIVIVSSTAGQRGEAGYSNYAASKGGQISFAKSLATELAPLIRVNCVAPGWVDTDLNASVFNNGHKEEIALSIPLQRIATADDVANPIVFLASDWSRHISGEVLNVNGAAVLCG
jgi:3-oxoacyl-[acyl-carrier protein] reductase